jgi:MraZ protein
MGEDPGRCDRGSIDVCKPTKVDQKGRLKIPATFATPFKEMGAACFITSEDGDCARIYPLPIWNEIEKRLMRRSQDDQQKRNLLLRAKYFGQTVNIDDQGRVLIPVVLRRSALIKGEVDVLDYQTYLEVWNHARFVRNLRRSPVTDQDETLLNTLAM